MVTMSELSNDQQENIIGSAITMIQALSEAFGPEHGIKVWETMSEILGPGVKETVFMAMLSGRSSGLITIKAIPVDRRDTLSKISVIKCIRNYTGMGLKEAKDVSDELWIGADKILDVKWQDRPKFANDLRNIGVMTL